MCRVDRRAATAELTPRCSVRPSYRLPRPRCRENLYPAGTSHFPRPWAGHVRRGRPPVRRLIVIVLFPLEVFSKRYRIRQNKLVSFVVLPTGVQRRGQKGQICIRGFSLKRIQVNDKIGGHSKNRTGAKRTPRRNTKALYFSKNLP